MTDIYLTGFGYFDDSGMGGASATPHPPIPVDELTWQTVSDEPFKRFGQLDAISKCAIVAIEAGGFARQTTPETAIAAATSEGCVGADIEFLQSTAGPTGASPRLFACTLPSTACGEAAIRYRWMGPAVCLVTRCSLDALLEAHHLVATGESPSCVALGYDGIFARAADTAATRGLRVQNGPACAYALLLQATPAAPPAGAWTLTDRPPKDVGELQVLGSLYDVKEFLTRHNQTSAGFARLDCTGRMLYLYREATKA